MLRRNCACALALAALLAATPASALADGTLAEAVNDLARDVAALLDARGEKQVPVAIKPFVGTGDEAHHATATPWVEATLQVCLKARGVNVVGGSDPAAYELSGEYKAMQDSNTDRIFVLFKGILADRKANQQVLEGIQLINFKRQVTKYYVKHETDVARLLGLNVVVPTAYKVKERERILAIRHAVDEPGVVLDGTRVRAGKDAKGGSSPFAVEIVTAAPRPAGEKHNPEDYQPATPQAKDTQALVPVGSGHVFAVKLVNDADHEVAVNLSIDGLGVFHAVYLQQVKVGRPAHRYVIVPARSSLLVRSWSFDARTIEEFTAAGYGRVHKTPPAGQLGTITALFHAAWDKADGKAPADEPFNPDDYAMVPAPPPGPEFAPFRHRVGVLRAAVSIRFRR